MPTRSVQVTQALRLGVLDGRYPGGTRMNEIDLAAALGVSRTPIRGALATLAAEGLLDYTPNSGYVVRRFTARDIANIYVVRARLDGMAAGLAAEVGLDAAARDALAGALAEGAALVAACSRDTQATAGWASLNTRFHAIIYDACGNDFLVSVLRRATDVPVVSHARFQSFDHDAMLRAHDDHVEIADAILNRQAQRAEALGAEHVYRAGRRIGDTWQRLAAGQEADPAAPMAAGD